MLPLSDVLARAAAGDASSQNELAARLLPEVRRLVHGQVERRLRRPGDAVLARLSTGDIVQEVLLEVLRSLDRWQASSEAAFIGMLATLVEHRLTDQLRHHRAERRDVRRDDAVGPQTAGVGDDRTPSSIAASREQSAIYREVFASCSDQERALLALRLEDRAPYKEIAARLDYPTADAACKAFRVAQARLAVRLSQRGLHAAEGDRA